MISILSFTWWAVPLLAVKRISLKSCKMVCGYSLYLIELYEL